MTNVTIELSKIGQLMKTLCDVSVACKEFSLLACGMGDIDEYKVMAHLDENTLILDQIYCELRSLTGLDPRDIDKISSYTRYLDTHLIARHEDPKTKKLLLRIKTLEEGNF